MKRDEMLCDASIGVLVLTLTLLSFSCAISAQNETSGAEESSRNRRGDAIAAMLAAETKYRMDWNPIWFFFSSLFFCWKGSIGKAMQRRFQWKTNEEASPFDSIGLIWIGMEWKKINRIGIKRKEKKLSWHALLESFFFCFLSFFLPACVSIR